MGADTPLRRTGGPGPVDDEPGVDGTSVEVARATATGSRARGGGGDRTVAAGVPCCTVRPPGREPRGRARDRGREWGPGRGRGWDAGAASPVAVEVLCAVASAAADRGIPRDANAHDGARKSSGEFGTARIGDGDGDGDGEQFRRIAVEIRPATTGIPGPAIPTDRAAGWGTTAARCSAAARASTCPTADRPGWPTPSRGRDRPPAADRCHPRARHPARRLLRKRTRCG